MGFFSSLKKIALPAIGLGLGIATGGAAIGPFAGFFGSLSPMISGGISGLTAGATASSILGLDRGKKPRMPKAQMPAAAAPTRREDTGANVRLGTLTKSQRVSGRTRGARGGTDVVGRLGLSGLSI